MTVTVDDNCSLCSRGVEGDGESTEIGTGVEHNTFVVTRGPGANCFQSVTGTSVKQQKVLWNLDLGKSFPWYLVNIALDLVTLETLAWRGLPRGCHVQISGYSDGRSVSQSVSSLKLFSTKLLYVVYSLKIVYSAQREQNSVTISTL